MLNKEERTRIKWENKDLFDMSSVVLLKGKLEKARTIETKDMQGFEDKLKALLHEYEMDGQDVVIIYDIRAFRTK